MKVTTGMSAEDAVRAELLAMRKSREGMTVNAIARSPAICHLLGCGDPKVAYNLLKHAVLTIESSTGVEAATYSLGLASDGQTHLDRLTEFGEARGYEQRQARRHSDKGIREIARFVATQWTVEQVPSLSVYLQEQPDGGVELRLTAMRPYVVEMRDVEMTLRTEGQNQLLPLRWTSRKNGWTVSMLAQASQLPARPFTVDLVWLGELWPRYRAIIGFGGTVELETLGAHFRATVGQ